MRERRGEGRGSEPHRAGSLLVWDLLLALQKLSVAVVDSDGWGRLSGPSRALQLRVKAHCLALPQ